MNPMINSQNTQQVTPMQAVQMIKSNPAQFFQKAGISVPENIMNDPNAIIQHLMQNGRVSQQQVNTAYQMAQRLGLK